MILLKALIGCFFAVGVVLAAIIVAAFIIRTARIMVHQVAVWVRGLRFKCPVCGGPLTVERYSPHCMAWAYCPPWQSSHAMSEQKSRLLAILDLYWYFRYELRPWKLAHRVSVWVRKHATDRSLRGIRRVS